ncbi:hypothetical protein VPH35_123268 [Triticum aestivum]|uniref:Uncharacterized protein n=1 Tax=Triticum turgidum subsp. durum TaxID=4567 RepID=A0A9R0ZC33_TRITD|nr:unnamed protein product [Triticum turgidum subsp. durum]
MPLDPRWRWPPSPGSTVAAASHPWIHAGGGLLRFRCGHSTKEEKAESSEVPPLKVQRKGRKITSPEDVVRASPRLRRQTSPMLLRPLLEDISCWVPSSCTVELFPSLLHHMEAMKKKWIKER